MAQKIKVINCLKKFFISLALLLSLTATAEAASLQLTPQSGNYSLGSIITTQVVVDTNGNDINAITGELTFTSDTLEVLSVSEAGSVISFWAQEPSYSNSTGQVQFEGIILTPGFSGSNGRVLTIRFRAQKAGLASISFKSGLVLANDGRSTNITENLGTAQFSIGQTGPGVGEATTDSTPGTPPAPRISSATHPDTNAWYNNSTAAVSWRNTSDITAVRISVNQNPNAIPSVTYTTPISERRVENLNDGTWYAHVQLQNNKGWGRIAHYRIQVDTTDPRIASLSEVRRVSPSNPAVSLNISATDQASGIDRIDILSGTEILPTEIDGDVYTLSSRLSPGEHDLAVRAYDRAGNWISDNIKVTVQPITQPRITSYPTRLDGGSTLVVKGEAIPNTKLILKVSGPNSSEAEVITRTNIDGQFSAVIAERSLSGTYRIFAISEDNKGALSLPSETVSILSTPPLFLALGDRIINALTLTIMLASLVIFLGIIIWTGWFRLAHARKRLRKDFRLLDLTAKDTFEVIHEELNSHLAIIKQSKEGSELTEKEIELYNELDRNIKNAANLLRKEINDSEKDIDL